MPRIHVTDPTQLKAIGKAIADASMDPSKRAAFLADAKSVLINDYGVAAEEFANIRLNVHEDSAVTINIAIPHIVDESRADDPAYLDYLGRWVVAGCRDRIPLRDQLSPSVVNFSANLRVREKNDAVQTKIQATA